MPAPFIPFSLGRFGRVPAEGTFAVYGHVVLANNFRTYHFAAGGPLAIAAAAILVRCNRSRSFYPALGVAYVLPFDSCASTSRAGSRAAAMDVQHRRQPRVLADS